MSHRRAVMLVAVLLSACGNEAAGPAGPGPTPTPTPTPTNPKVAKPALDPIAATTCGKEIAVNGTAPAGTSVFAVGGASTSGISTDANAQNGRFCLPVTLKAGQPNRIEVRVQDPQRGLSDAVVITVTQQSCKAAPTPSAPETPEPRNVALGATVTAKDKPKLGNETLAVDGLAGTAVVYEGGSVWCNWCDYEGWVAVKLAKVVEVSKVVVRWRDSKGAGTSYGGAYKLLISAMSEPGTPDLKSGRWVEAASVTDGDGGLDIFDLSQQKPLVQHVALWLQQDGYPWTKEFIGKEAFAIGEIEVFDNPSPSSTQPTETNACAATN